ncbi:glycoside hydrolase family 13 protein [Clostridium butyricum]|jgi:glycosidase|uniref:Alpha-amylase n=2 Tax=Clostridium butyricum TaxID=1492 RepID=A0A512TTR9_CLOBU|nr:glycoside hydrolase family 13 protein [Clostridium butyricum]MBS5984891.1 glycoside hydrolase family 13 protein [Clostridium butyricum]MBZ0314749.1 glycoside hydrolase family 13 protein [Clostridium butyricum]MDB2154119.1 glycoside hydrolase family 13 protein [Clostridium butyricum]NAS19756.1 glycoside hydrolase family 13 protein [Clostridium butyricum]NOW23986.1 glycosidase [Clostridium butyricum]
MDRIKVMHDSQSIVYRRPFGAVEEGQKVKLSIDIEKEIVVAIELLQFDGTKVNMGMEKEYLNSGNYRYSIEIDTEDALGVLGYYFILIDGYDRVYYGNNDEHLGGIGQIYTYNPVPYQITIYKKSNLPEWYKEGIIYQIFVDRFCNGNDDGSINNPKKNSFIYGRWDDTPVYIKDYQGRTIRWDFYGGNIRGIIKKLDYIKSLGVNIINLSPIFKSSSCHKYDAGDYDIIDEMFGTEEDFKELCEKAKSKDIKIILDGVFSYTSSDSRYFNKAGNYDEIGAYQSPNSKYHNWYKFNRYPYGYECWWGIEGRPNINVMHNSYIDFLVNRDDSIIKKWIDLGASGWRLNVTDELPDEFIEIIRDRLDTLDKETVLIGDVWDDASNKISYSKKRRYLYGKEIQSVTNYPLRESLINFTRGYIKSDKLKKKVMSLYENYPREVFLGNINLIGTSDTERILTVLDGNMRCLKIIVALQFTIPGVPLIYYGDETGVTGGKDPDNRKSYPWENEDVDLIGFYKRIAQIRNGQDALKKGDFNIFDTEEDIFAFERVYENERIVVVVNISNAQKVVRGITLEGTYLDLFNEGEKYKFVGYESVLIMYPCSFKILRKINK